MNEREERREWQNQRMKVRVWMSEWMNESINEWENSNLIIKILTFEWYDIRWGANWYPLFRPQRTEMV
jgi:hypothetical protein